MFAPVAVKVVVVPLQSVVVAAEGITVGTGLIEIVSVTGAELIHPVALVARQVIVAVVVTDTVGAV